MKITIGTEHHIQLEACKSKLYCSCPTFGSEDPNSRTCETCLGHPGSKPVLNYKAIEQALKVALALNCKIISEMFFSRKSYFYPDLPKNFQITQFEIPIASYGLFDNIRIRRLHLEEDPGKLIHKEKLTLVDYNRSGIPLIEIVTEPDFKSANEVRLFLQKLNTMLEYLNVYTRRSEASLRTDANISINDNERVEIKNITGIKDVEKALNYEIIRQQNLIRNNQTIVRETRQWDSINKTTKLLRTKETEEDYGYIFEPDLTKIEVLNKQIEKVKKSLPELADEKRERLIKEYKIDEKDAEIIANDYLIAKLFEDVAKKIDPVFTVRWIRRELLRVLHYNKLIFAETKINEIHLIDLFSLIKNKKITETTGQKILEKLIIKPFSVKKYVKKNKLELVSTEKELEEICLRVLKENREAVRDYKRGKEESLHFLMGKVMKITKGTAAPEVINKLLKKLIK